MKRVLLLALVAAFAFATLPGCEKKSSPDPAKKAGVKVDKKAGPAGTQTVKDNNIKKPITRMVKKPVVKNSTGSQGKIEFVKADHDFGVVNQGESLKHVFVFKNTGTGMLKVDRAKGG